MALRGSLIIVTSKPDPMDLYLNHFLGQVSWMMGPITPIYRPNYVVLFTYIDTS